MLKVFTLEEAEQWDAIVRSFEEHDVYWLSGYARAFYLHGDGEPMLIHYEGPNGRAINVVMKRDISDDARFAGRIPEGEYFDLTTPYGYGGWLIEGCTQEDLFDEYSQWIEDNGIVSEFVRFHPLAKNQRYCGDYYKVVELGKVVCVDLSSPETIWSNFSSKNRNMIRKAIKNGVKVYNGRFPEIYEAFRGIYNGTMERDEAREYYFFGEDYYRSLLLDLPYNAQVFYSVKDGVIIAAAIMLCANGRMSYHLSGSLKEYGNLAATNLLLYEAALWGSANGCQTLYLGGGVGSGEDGLFKFKKAFYRGELDSYHIGMRVCAQSKYDKLVDIGGLPESSFFPKYRA